MWERQPPSTLPLLYPQITAPPAPSTQLLVARGSSCTCSLSKHSCTPDSRQARPGMDARGQVEPRSDDSDHRDVAYSSLASPAALHTGRAVSVGGLTHPLLGWELSNTGSCLALDQGREQLSCPLPLAAEYLQSVVSVQPGPRGTVRMKCSRAIQSWLLTGGPYPTLQQHTVRVAGFVHTCLSVHESRRSAPLRRPLEGCSG